MAGVALGAAPAPAGAASSVSLAVRYLESARNGDGGFGPIPGARSAPAVTDWSAIGLAAAGRSPTPSLARALARGTAQARTTGDAARTTLALRAAGLPGFAALTRRLLAARHADGSFEGRVNTTSFTVLALRSAGRSPSDHTLRAAVTWIRDHPARDGGFNFAGAGTTGDADDTGAALEALVAGGVGPTAPVVRRAVAFLAAQQRPDGGFGLAPGAVSNAQSTAFAVQGLVAAGRDVDRLRRHGSRSPLGFLRSLQASDGSIRYSRTSRQTPVFVTAQALAALARRPLPIFPG